MIKKANSAKEYESILFHNNEKIINFIKELRKGDFDTALFLISNNIIISYKSDKKIFIVDFLSPSRLLEGTVKRLITEIISQTSMSGYKVLKRVGENLYTNFQ